MPRSSPSSTSSSPGGSKTGPATSTTTAAACGGRVVLRLLDKTSSILLLSDLGMDARKVGIFNSLIKSPYGIVLVTGPTGSGKTTTLYAALTSINSAEVNIITIAD